MRTNIDTVSRVGLGTVTYNRTGIFTGISPRTGILHLLCSSLKGAFRWLDTRGHAVLLINQESIKKAFGWFSLL